MTVQLALRKNDTRIGSRFICLWSGSVYSHCELVVDGLCYSSSIMDKGVRSKAVGTGQHDIDLDPAKWDVIDIPQASPDRIRAYFEMTDANTYGWFSMIGSQLFNRGRTDEKSQFCSEWCANALGLPNPSIYSPGALAIQCKYMLAFNPI